MPFYCPDCNKRYVSVPVFPLFCGCGAKHTNIPTENAWEIIHSRYAAAIESGIWDEAVERIWLDTEFIKLVPQSCGSCGSKWLSLSATIDLSTAWTAFESLWRAHNTVNTEHVVPAKEPVTWERCKALYLRQPVIPGIVAVTSLSPSRLGRQAECLTTWDRFGLVIHAVQSASEIESMRSLYPMVSEWHVSEESPPFIWQLAEVAERVLLINSDIEIHGEQRILTDALSRGSVIGVRHNYKDNWWVSEKEQWGLDVFSFDAALPRLPLRIGKPMWDYFVPHHFKETGITASWITESLFFHKTHPLNWSQADWQVGAEIFTKHYGLDIGLDWVAYRGSLSESKL